MSSASAEVSERVNIIIGSPVVEAFEFFNSSTGWVSFAVDSIKRIGSSKPPMASLTRCITTVPVAAVLSFLTVTNVLAFTAGESEIRFRMPPVVSASAETFIA